MPFKSEAQRRLFHAKAERGEISESKVHEWERATPKAFKKNMPYHVKKSASELADEVLAKLGAPQSIGVFTAGKGGPKALERVVSREKPLPRKPTQEPVDWRKPSDPKRKGEAEMLKFFSLKESSFVDPFLSKLALLAPSRSGVMAAGSAAPKNPATPAPLPAAPSANAAGIPGAGGGGAAKLGSVDPDVLAAAVLKSESGPSSLWRSLTGLSDDLLIAGENVRRKMERREKNAAEQVASSLSMMTKMADVTKKDVAGFFRNNPNPPDKKLHAWSEGKGEEPDDVEAKAYQLATERVHGGMRGGPDKVQGGKADGKPSSNYDPHELAMGKKVEQEHTSDPQLAEEIARDHLEEIPDYYTRLKRMEDAAPKKEACLTRAEKSIFGTEEEKRKHYAAVAASETPMKRASAGLLAPPEEQPVATTSPLAGISPDIFQLLRAQALIDQSKTAQAYPNDSGDVRIPYQRERENMGQGYPEVEQAQDTRQLEYNQQLAEQMRQQRIEHEYTNRVRRGEIVGGLGGLAGGAGLGYLMTSPGSKWRIPAMMAGSVGAGLLGKGLGRSIGQKQGVGYLQQYTGVPWEQQ